MVQAFAVPLLTDNHVSDDPEHHLLLGEYDHGVRKAWHPESTAWQVRAEGCM